MNTNSTLYRSILLAGTKAVVFIACLFILLLCSSVCLRAQNQLGSAIFGEEQGDWCGYDVAISANGNRIAVSSPKALSTNQGYVRAYEWSGSEWVQRGTDIVGENNGDNSGVSIDMSDSGDRIIIGSWRNNGSRGHARIFEWNGSDWDQLGNDIDGEDPVDHSGKAVAISGSGSRVVIGAQLNDDLATNAGHARIFEWNGTDWLQVGNEINGVSYLDHSGSDVALSYNGDRVAIGAWGHDGGGTDAGHVRVFGFNGNIWEIVGDEIDGEAAGDGLHVVSLSADGNRLAVAAGGNDDAGTDAGHVRVYAFQSPDWIQIGADIDADTSFDYLNRVRISNDGHRICVGMQGNDANGNSSGKSRVYDYINGSWVQVSEDIKGFQEFELFGYNVDISGDGQRIICGAPITGVPGQSGSARVFDVCPVFSTLSNTIIDSDRTLFAQNLISLDSVIVLAPNTLTLKSKEVLINDSVRVDLGAELITVYETGCH